MIAHHVVFTPKTSPVQQNKHLACMSGVGFWFFSSPRDTVWSLLSSLYIFINHRFLVSRAEQSNQRRVIDTLAETTARVSFYSAVGDGEGTLKKQESPPFQAFHKSDPVYFLLNGTLTGSYAYKTNFRNERTPHP